MKEINCPAGAQLMMMPMMNGTIAAGFKNKKYQEAYKFPHYGVDFDSRYGEDFKVVAVGKRTRYADDIVAYLEKNGIRDRFLFFHNVPFADLPSFYRLATAFVYPSRIEGFGIPLLEAISSRLPAIGCTGSCLEEAGGPGSIYVDPNDAEAMAEALHKVMGDADLRQQMIKAGLDHAKLFTDINLAIQLHNVYEKIKTEQK